LTNNTIKSFLVSPKDFCLY